MIAVDRDREVLTELDSHFRFQAGDHAIVAGPDEAVTRFTGEFGTTERHEAATPER